MSLGLDELIENYFSTLEADCIDSFRELVASSICAEFHKVEARYETHLEQDYADPQLRHFRGSSIEDDRVHIGYMSELANELSIMALYKVFEEKHRKLIAHHRNEGDSKKYSYWEEVLRVLPIRAKELNSFRAVDELRLLNNAIKHDGVISTPLFNKFPEYGEVGNDLNGLNEAYERLKPNIVEYIYELHQIYKVEKSSRS